MGEFRREDCKQCGAPVPPRRRSLCDACVARNELKHNKRHAAEQLERRRTDPEYRDKHNAYQREWCKSTRELERHQLKEARKCEKCGGPIP